MQEKLYFRQICELHDFGIAQLKKIIREAEVPQSIIDAILHGEPVSPADAVKVLTAVSKITGRTYNLSNVAIVLSSLDLEGSDG